MGEAYHSTKAQRNLVRPNFAHCFTDEQIKENKYVLIKISPELLSDPRVKRSAFGPLVETILRRDENFQQRVIEFMDRNMGTVGEFILRKTTTLPIHRTLFVLGRVVLRLDHFPQKFLSKECKNTIKQNFEYKMEQREMLITEELNRNIECANMYQEELLSIAYNSPYDDVLFQLYSEKRNISLQDNYIKNMESLVNDSKAEAKVAQNKLAQKAKNEIAIFEHKEKTFKAEMETILRQSFSQGLPKRATASRKKRTIYSVIRRKIGQSKELVKALRKVGIIGMLTNHVDVKVRNIKNLKKDLLPNSSTTKAYTSWFISNTIWENECNYQIQKKYIKDNGPLIDRSELHDKIVEISELKHVKEKAFMLDHNIKFVFDFSEKEKNVNKQDMSMYLGTSLENSEFGLGLKETEQRRDTLESSRKNSVSSMDSKSHVSSTKWHGFDKDAKLYNALDALNIPTSVLDNEDLKGDNALVKKTIGELSKIFGSKHYIYYCNNILTKKTTLNAEQKKQINKFFRNPDKAITWFTTFCTNLKKPDIINDAIAFGLSRNNKFHLTIMRFLADCPNFDIV